MSETIRDVILDGEALRLVRRDEDAAVTLSVEAGEETQETAAELISARPGWVTLRVGGRTRRARPCGSASPARPIASSRRVAAVTPGVERERLGSRHPCRGPCSRS
jgi:hypothetical protein